MGQLWFDVKEAQGHVVVTVHADESPEILEKMMRLLNVGEKYNLSLIMLEFPEESVVINLLRNMLYRLRVVTTSGVHCGAEDGKYIIIETV